MCTATPAWRQSAVTQTLHIEAKKFGDHVTADHFMARNEFDRGYHGEKSGLLVADVATDDLDCYGCKDQYHLTAYEHLNDYEGRYSNVILLPRWRWRTR